MNQTLTGIAIAVVVAIVIALVAPFLIDWSSYRGSVESRAADILGRQVRIEGDMELRLLPQPVLRARNVVAGDGETPDITIEQLDMTMSLTPLLSGEISVSEATISQPVIHLSVDDAGRLTLGGGGDFPVDPENVSLDHVEVRGGLVLMDDARSGTVTRFENVNLTGSAVSLLGPLKLEGSAVHDGVVNSFSLQTGRVTPDSALRVKLGVIPANRPVAFDSDGVLTIEEGAPVFNGRIRLEGLDLNDARQLKGPVWRIDADVRGTGGSVEAKKATLTVGDPDSGPALEGDGMLTLGGDPRLTVNLSTRQVDLDRHLGGGDQTSIPVLLGKLAEVVAAIDVPVPVEATLDIGGIVAGGVLFENLKADVASADGGWRIGGLRVDGPGGARLALSGKLDLAGTAPAFEGRGVINARNGTASMLALAGRGDIPGLGRPDGPVSGEADISLSTDRLYLNGMSLRYDDTNLTGDLAYVHTDGERKRLTLDVDADRLDADGLGALLSQVAGGAGGLDVEARLKIASLLSGSTDIGAVSLDTSFDGRQFTLNELKVAGANGTRIDGKGALQGLDDQPSGDIAVDVEAGSIGAVAALVEAFGRPDVALALRQRGEGLAPLKLAFALKGAHAGAGTAVTLSASGRAGGGPLDLKLGFEGDFSSWRTGRAELTLDAENPDGSALLALTGIQMTMPGDAAGSLSLKLSGTPSTGLDTTALFTGAGLRFDLAGKSIVGDTGIVLDGVRLVATADDPVLAAAGFGEITAYPLVAAPTDQVIMARRR